MWAIVAIAVGLAALILWNAISPQLPAGLRLPQTPSDVHETEPQHPPSSVTASIGPNRWTVWQDGANWRLSREFLTPVQGKQLIFYPPVLHVSCYPGRLYAWLVTHVAPLTDSRYPRSVSIEVNEGPPQLWAVVEGAALAAPRPHELLRVAAEAPRLTVKLAFSEAALQSLSLNTDGIKDFPFLYRCD